MKTSEISWDGDTECACGRSPTGLCIGWHSLDTESYKVELKNWVDLHFLNEDLTRKVKEDSVNLA